MGSCICSSHGRKGRAFTQVATVLDLVEGDTGAFRSRLKFMLLRPSCPHAPATLPATPRANGHGGHVVMCKRVVLSLDTGRKR